MHTCRGIASAAYVCGIDAEWDCNAAPSAALLQLGLRTRAGARHVLLLVRLSCGTALQSLKSCSRAHAASSPASRQDLLALPACDAREFLALLFRCRDLLKVSALEKHWRGIPCACSCTRCAATRGTRRGRCQTGPASRRSATGSRATSARSRRRWAGCARWSPRSTWPPCTGRSPSRAWRACRRCGAACSLSVQPTSRAGAQLAAAYSVRSARAPVPLAAAPLAAARPPSRLLAELAACLSEHVAGHARRRASAAWRAWCTRSWARRWTSACSAARGRRAR